MSTNKQVTSSQSTINGIIYSEAIESEGKCCLVRSIEPSNRYLRNHGSVELILETLHNILSDERWTVGAKSICSPNGYGRVGDLKLNKR